MPPPPQTTELEKQIEKLEERFRESAEELKDLRLKLVRTTQDEIEEIKDEWHGVHYKWWVITLSGVLALFVFSYFLYTRLGWVAEQRSLPMGSDWLLRRLPVVNVLPVLSWGFFALHLFAAGAAILYYPRRMPFLLFMLSVYMVVRTAFVFLSPIGPPVGIVDMRQLDFIFAKIMGTWTFNNEFVFSGHTGIPFLFYLFFETRGLKTVMMAGSVTMAVCVLLSHNHYTVDVLAGYLVSYSIYALSEKLYYGWIRPLFQILPSRIP
ncbi:MAG: hypothetical protein HY077_11805 [Elusimicrobia bacterium]|nr:hypothetical protein [Elusimicrobiota bacterium]